VRGAIGRRGALSLGLAAVLGSACTRNGGPPRELLPTPPKLEVAYVSPEGGDAAEGTEAAPFATLERALRTDRPRIVLLAGTLPEAQVVVSRSVRIEAKEAGRAALDGHLFISASDVTLHGVHILGGVGVHLARGVRVESATVAFGLKDDAVSVVSSEVALSDLTLRCGPETCLQVTTSTVEVARVSGVADAGSKRVVRVEASRAALRDFVARGSGTTQLQVSLRSRLTVRTATLADAGGTALAALQDSLLDAEDVHVTGAQRAALLVQRARAEVSRSTFEAAPGGLGVGLSGGVLHLSSSTVAPARDGALNLTRHAGQPAQLTLRGGVVRHGPYDGVVVGGGLVVVEGTRFEGGGAGTEGDGILVTGEGNRVEVRRATFVDTPGFAVALHQDALGTVTATVVSPGLGGVLVEDVAVDAVRLEGLVVRGCRQGSGVVALLSPRVEVVGGRVEGCAEAGYLAGQGSGVSVQGARAVDNAQYGFAAFGGSSMDLGAVRARGSRWAAFAACGDGSRVEVDAASVLEGATVLCP
jgi:hypothetical protein